MATIEIAGRTLEVRTLDSFTLGDLRTKVFPWRKKSAALATEAEQPDPDFVERSIDLAAAGLRLYLGDAPTTLELIEGLTLAELWPTLNRVLAVSRGEAAPGEAKGP